MMTDVTGALAKEHINSLLASATRHNLASEARRARATIARCGPRLGRLLAARRAAVCRPATCCGPLAAPSN